MAYRKLMVTGFLAAVSLCASAATPTTRPIPEPAAQAAARRLIREVYQKDYAARSPAERQALGRKLLQQAIETQDDPAARYVLLQEARELAAGAADAPTVARAVQQLSQLHGVDAGVSLHESLGFALRAATMPQSLAEITHAALSAADQAVLRDDYPVALQLGAIADSAAQKSKDLALIKNTQARTKELQVIAAEYRRVQAALATLKQKPDDAAACLLAGRFLCLVKNDWNAGLHYLSISQDPTLSALAQLDRSAPADYMKRLELAGGWWDVAQSQTGLARKHALGRSARWYRLALPALSGLNRSAAQQRLETIDAESLKELNLQPGLSAELHKGIEFANLVGTRVDPQINFDWSEDAPDERLTKDNFSIRWTGMLRISTAGRHQITALANMAARIWIDDKLIIDGTNLWRQRNGMKVPVELSAGLHSIRIDYWDTGGMAKMRLTWTAPGGKDEPIPASAFWHDPTAGPQHR